MPVICRLLALSPEQATGLIAQPETLTRALDSAKIYTDVYRYWHGIQFLLVQHRHTSPAADWLALGQTVSTTANEIPAARVILPEQVAELDSILREVEPEALIPHYNAGTLDQANIYPRQWTEWEETFDPLGQLLEHYSFLQSFARRRSSAGDAMLLYFVFVDDGSDS